MACNQRFPDRNIGNDKVVTGEQRKSKTEGLNGITEGDFHPVSIAALLDIYPAVNG